MTTLHRYRVSSLSAPNKMDRDADMSSPSTDVRNSLLTLPESGYFL